MNRSMTVVKVGGSLFDIRGLGTHLHRWLGTFDAAPYLLIPGGGAAADAIRAFDSRHQLGEEKSHWLALHALTLNAYFLAGLVPGGDVTDDWRNCREARSPGHVPVLNCFPFALADEGQPGCLPHSWEVTSDSVAARVAVVAGAEALVLLKSVDIPDGVGWEEAGKIGWVDPYFARAVSPGLAVRTVNFRRWCRQEG